MRTARESATELSRLAGFQCVYVFYYSLEGQYTWCRKMQTEHDLQIYIANLL